MKNALLGAFALLAVAGCHTDMWYQAKVTPYDKDESGIFADGAANRPLVDGTVARGWARQGDAKYSGTEGGKYVDAFPEKLSIDGEELDSRKDMIKIIRRGKERFTIYCSHCHGAAGDGRGMITQRGFTLVREPATFHSDRLRGMPLGYFYDVITNGVGIMYSQAPRVKPSDRWAIVAYIRTLQLSQRANRADLSPEDLQKMQEMMAPKEEPK